MEQVKKFMGKLQNDEALKAKFDELGKNKTGLDDIIALAAENGFIFTEGDWKNCVNAELGSGKQELGEAELEAVSGGGWQAAGCRFEANSTHETLYPFIKLCKFYNNLIVCNPLVCGCWGDDCLNGCHHVDENNHGTH